MTERKSLAYLADKFNTQAPPGYVPGRGRGVNGFSKPPAEPPSRGSKPPRGSTGIPTNEDSAPATASDRFEVEASDTRELDLGETEAFELDEMSMDQREAGAVIEPFNMKQERREGHFDDDFNYVWKSKGEDDEVHDAWLGEVDEAAESDEKVQKRRRLLERQMDVLQTQDEAAPDVPAHAAEVALLLKPHETVAAALRRLGPTKKGVGAGAKGSAGRRGRGAAAQKEEQPLDASAEAERAKQFTQLTEAADKLLRGGRLDIFSETREVLQEVAGGAAFPPEGGLPKGVPQEVHEAVVAGGYALDTASGYYFSSASGMCFDAVSNLYWSATAGSAGSFYRFDATSQQFVPLEQAVGGHEAQMHEAGG
eukprot:CAMPEP_0119377498 /NCGR_PEP_ID=MMETSP1334-20130426/45198_1 /TAXON_ID=127549 /ORGANISM="Calcidiscus leptoporus, Strain RCC1130" /LENGTH=366 /DNA_ID=CAMNT_0007396443 /DNA_START=128 /DNA_END=1225 /DNA_ORIENTATION=-